MDAVDMDVVSGSDAASRPPPDSNAAAQAEQAAGDRFGLDAEVLVGDIRDAVEDFCADGFDALTQCLLHDLPLESLEQQNEIIRASEALCEHTRARLDEQMGLFQGHALHGCLQIPPGLSLPEEQQQQSLEGGVTADSAAADRLKGELAELRAAIRVARSAVRQVHVQIAAMDRDLAAHGDRTGLEEAAALAAGKENIADDACAIAVDAARLRPLLAKAQRLVQAAKPAPSANSVVAADQELRKRQGLSGHGPAPTAIDVRALRAANQIMSAHTQQVAAAQKAADS